MIAQKGVRVTVTGPDPGPRKLPASKPEAHRGPGSRVQSAAAPAACSGLVHTRLTAPEKGRVVLVSWAPTLPFAE